MRRSSFLGLIVFLCATMNGTAGPPTRTLPAVAAGLVDRSGRRGAANPLPHRDRRGAGRDALPRLRPDGHAGPAHRADRSVVAIKNGKVRTFADKLWSVMGLEWVDGTLYVVHAPFLSAFRDTDGDGKADCAGRPHHGPGPQAARLQWHQRPHRLGHPARDGRVPVHRCRRQGDSPRRRPRRHDHPAPWRRRDPRPARRHGAGSRLDRRVQPAVGRTLGDRRGLHLRQRRRQQEMAQQPDPSHRRRPLRLSVPVPDRPAPRPADRGRASSAARGPRGSATTRMGFPPSIGATCSSATGASRPSIGSRSARTGGTFALASRTPLVTKGEVGDFPPVLPGRRGRRPGPLAGRLGL